MLLGELGSEDVLGHYLPYFVGGVVAILVLTYLALRGWKLHEDPPEAVVLPPKVSSIVAEERADRWAPPEVSYADRRGSVRREGPPTRVVLSSPSFRNGIHEGFVVDRSTGGLRILMQGTIPEGSNLLVRAANAPDTVGFVRVVVRSCRENGDYLELGCEFEKTPPWNVLLLFG